jgi:hypothetical protein
MEAQGNEPGFELHPMTKSKLRGRTVYVLLVAPCIAGAGTVRFSCCHLASHCITGEGSNAEGKVKTVKSR